MGPGAVGRHFPYPQLVRGADKADRQARMLRIIGQMGQAAVAGAELERPTIDALGRQATDIDFAFCIQIDAVQAGILTPSIQIGGINYERAQVSGAGQGRDQRRLNWRVGPSTH